MGTRHDEQERDIELNDVTERLKYQRLQFKTNHHDLKKRRTKKTSIHYLCVLTTNQFYLFLFTIGVSMDTLFLFIPAINENNKCITIENKVKIVAIILRSVTDIFFIELILYKVLVAFGRSKRSWVWYFNILIDIFGVVPLPQVLILHFFTGVGSSKQLIKRKVLNLIIMLQYFPRTLKIYRAYLGIKKGSFVSPKAVIFWNLFFFFVLSHIFGSFWYFFAVQRATSCWHKACKETFGCDFSSFDCKDNNRKYLAFITKNCSINKPDTSTTNGFDFGIYAEAIKTGLLTNTSEAIPKKILHSFWWGLRNLSYCGQNLQSSGYVWETCFAALVTTSGLILFLYFIGQVQVYIELLADAITKEKWLGMKYREIDVDAWLNYNNIPNKDKIKETLMQRIQYMPEIKDIHLKILLPLLSAQERRSIKNWLCYPILKKVAALQNVNTKILEEIITCLKPVIYSENSYIIHEGEPLGFMFLITQGIIWNFKTNNGNNNNVNNIMGNYRCISKGHIYGEQLLERILKSIFYKIDPNLDILISDTNVKAHTKVEAFVIMDKDIRNIISRFKIPIIQSYVKSGKEDLNLESSAASIIQGTFRWRRATIEAAADLKVS